MGRRDLSSCVPTTAVLRVLTKEQRAKMLLLIIRAIKDGWSPVRGAKCLLPIVMEDLGPNREGNPHRGRWKRGGPDKYRKGLQE